MSEYEEDNEIREEFLRQTGKARPRRLRIHYRCGHSVVSEFMPHLEPIVGDQLICWECRKEQEVTGVNPT